MTSNSILYSYKNFSIKLPVGHNLPLYREKFPKYDTLLPLLSKYIGKKQTVIDIGANIGDTLAGMAAKNPDASYVCIEPDDFFYDYLQENITIIKKTLKGLDVHAIKALIGVSITNVKLDGQDGTKHAVPNKDGGIKSITLDEVISLIPNQDIRLIKSDVDGFDYDVLNSSLSVIKKYKPIIFFECDYKLLYQKTGYLKTLESLETIGYCDWILFDNFGGKILRTSDLKVISEIFDYIWRQNTQADARTIFYCDILAVQKNDSNLIDKVLNNY